VLGTAAGLTLAWLLLERSGGVARAIPQIVGRVASADPGLLSGALCLFLLSQVLRAFRWMILSFQDRVPFSVSMPVTSIHIGLGHLLPARLTDVVFVALFRHIGAVPVGRGTASILHAKLLDIVAMGVVTGFSVAAGMGKAAIAAPLLALVGCLGILYLAPLLRALRRPLNRVMCGMGLAVGSDWYSDLVEASSVRGRMGKVSAAFAISLSAWVVKLSMFCMLIASLGVTGIPFWKVFFASGVTDLTMALPVNGLLSIGTLEAGWTAGFAMVGVEGIVPPGISIVELGFSVHLLWMSMAVLLMVLSLPWLWITVRAKQRAAVREGETVGGE
jgi:hypothetical protein